MKEILDIIVYWFKDYYADGMYILFAFLACVYLVIIDGSRYLKLIIPSIAIVTVIFNPWLYKYIFYKLIFWRLFWMIPCVLFIALASVELIGRIEKLWKKIVFCIGVILLFSVLGNDVFKGASRGDTRNIYGLSEATIDVADVMLQYDDSPRCILSRELISQIRLYNGNIEPMYGRNAEGYINYADDSVKAMYSVMESESPDYTYVLTRALHWGYSFVVNTDSRPIDEALAKRYGYELIATTDGYNVYYNSRIDISEDEAGYSWRFDGTGWWYGDDYGDYYLDTVQQIDGSYYYFNRDGYALDNLSSDMVEALDSDDIIITQFGKDDYQKPSMCYTIDDQEGHFIIIDGGNADEVDQIMGQIWLYGGRVDAWILTHPHSDHIGAFNEIYEQYKDQIEIEKIYAIGIDNGYYHEIANTWDEIEYYDRFNELMADKSNPNYGALEYVERGDTYSIGDCSFKVYNTFTEESYDIETGSLPNAASMVLEVFGSNESMLFLGDLEQGNADLIEGLYGKELEADYVQAAHHGQNINDDFYDNILVNTKTITVDAPAWLRQEDEDNHTAYEHLVYFEEKNIRVVTYDTTPNVVVVD